MSLMSLAAVQIDNEYSQTSTTGPYFEALENAYTSGGIAVPLTYNDPGEGKNFVNGTVRMESCTPLV